MTEEDLKLYSGFQQENYSKNIQAFIDMDKFDIPENTLTLKELQKKYARYRINYAKV